MKGQFYSRLRGQGKKPFLVSRTEGGCLIMSGRLSSLRVLVFVVRNSWNSEKTLEGIQYRKTA